MKQPGRHLGWRCATGKPLLDYECTVPGPRLPVYTAKGLFLDTLFDHARLQEADDRFDVGTAFQCTCVDEVFRVASGLVGYIARGNDLADIPTYQYIISILLPLQSDN